MDEIAKRLKEARENAKMKQTELAERLGKAQTTIASMENGRSTESFKTLKSICEILNVSADWILFGNTGQPEEPDLNEEGCRLLEEYKEYLKERYPTEEKEYTKAGNL